MKFFDKKDFAKLLIKYRYLSIGLVLIVVCLLATGLTKLTFIPDLETYFPEGHPAVIRYNEIDDIQRTLKTITGVHRSLHGL